MITNGFTYVAVLMFMAAVLVTLDKSSTGVMKKFFSYDMKFVYESLALRRAKVAVDRNHRAHSRQPCVICCLQNILVVE